VEIIDEVVLGVDNATDKVLLVLVTLEVLEVIELLELLELLEVLEVLEVLELLEALELDVEDDETQGVEVPQFGSVSYTLKRPMLAPGA